MVLYNFFFFFFFAPLLLRNGYYCKAYALKSDEERNRGGRKDFIIESIGGITSWWRHEKTRDKSGRIGEHTRRTLLRRTPKQDFGQKEAHEIQWPTDGG